jgi:hypothetical protein
MYGDENATIGYYSDTCIAESGYGFVRRSIYIQDSNLVNNHIKPIQA